MTDFASLLADPTRAGEAVDAVPRKALPALVLQLAALQSRAAARLMNEPARAPEPQDEVLGDVGEVARIVRRSESWVRKRGHTLPGFRQPGGKGTRVTWSRRALEIWARGESA